MEQRITDSRPTALRLFSLLLSCLLVWAMGLSGPAAAQTSVSASDRIYEDRVDLTWSRVSTPEVVYQVERDGRQIASLASTDSTYSDTEGDPTFTYTYCVFAESDTGRQQLGCDAGTRALNAPVNLTASVRTQASGVALAWDDRSSIEDGFLLFRKVTGTDADSTQIALLPRNTDRYEDESAEPDVRYTYCLASTNDTRDFFSERICAEGIRAVVQPPAEVRASDGSYDDRVFLSWTDNSDRDAGFQISRIELDDAGVEIDTTVLPVTAPNATTYSDLEAVNGTPYRYCVKTVAQGGGTSIADCDRGIRGVLPTPTPVQASTDEFDDRVVVQWGDPSESESGFEVWRKEAGTPFDSNRVATPGKNVQEYIDNDAIPGTSYAYFVRAVAEDGGASDFATDTGRQSVVLAPTGMNATDDAFEDRVALNWQNPSTTATVVRIYRDGVQIQTLPAETVSFEDTEAASGVTREYCVEHITDAGALSSRACDTGIRTILPPEDVTASDRTDETSVRLTWTDASSVETEQHIYRDGVVIDTVAADAVSYRDGTAVPAQVHTYDVQAVDDWGASERVSDAGERVLNPPTEVQASDDESELEITLSWLDNSSVEDGYYVYRKTSATDSTLAGTTDANAVSFTDTGMDVGAELTYSVIPFDEFGSSSAREDAGSTVLLPPASLKASTDGGSVALSWVDESDFEEGYEVSREGTVIYTSPPNGDVYVDVVPSSEPGQEYTYTVKTIANGGESTPATLKIVFPDAAAPVNPIFDQTPVVEANDGTQPDQVYLRWNDVSDIEAGYRVYRDGRPVTTLNADVEAFTDQGIAPGEIQEYCVAPVDQDGFAGARGCDIGRRPPNGALTGRVTTLSGAAVDSIDVCLNPNPGRSIQFDGTSDAFASVSGARMGTNAFTLETWARAREGGFTKPLFYYESTAPDGSSQEVRLYYGSPIIGDPGVTLGLNGTSSDFSFSQELRDGKWHHVAVTWQNAQGSATTGTLELYVDGTFVEAVPGFDGTFVSGGRLTFGEGLSLAGSFGGLMDDMRVWGDVRTAEEIQANYRQRLRGDEDDLLGYWPVENATAQALADLTDDEGSRYASLRKGTYRSQEIAPIRVCGLSDSEGNYDLSGIRYSDETTFRITPEREGRSFDPAYKSITLSPGNPVQNEVGFNDISSYGISGSVQYAGTQCFVQDLPIGLDGNPTGKTDDEGQYRISAQYGERVVAPQIDGRTFSPASETLFLEEDVFGVNFTETTTRSLSGQVSGGCGISIGTVTLAVESENQCLQRDVVVSNGSYDLDLPPQAYTVRVTDVTDVPAGLSKTEILKYFEGLGSTRVDLTDSTQVADFIYRAPLRVTVSGAPEPAGQCASGLQAAENALPNVTVLEQAPAEGIPLTIEVAEDYGSELCPVDTGTVEVFDEWADTESQPRERIITDGIARDTTFAVTPTFTSRVVDGVDRTYQKAYTAAATVEGRTAQRTNWALITGRRLREGSDFVTGSTGELPILILRDPPGDASQTTVAQNKSFCQSLSTTTTISTANNLSFEAKVGFEFDSGFPGFTTNTELEATSGRSLSVNFSKTDSETAELCVQTDREYSTSDSPLFVGDQGDVFIGTGLNLVFAETDVLEGDPADTCSFDRSTAVAFEPDGFATTYAFTRYHIKNALLPRLSDFIGRYEEEYQQTGSDAALDSLNQFRADSLNWAQHLVYNDSLKGVAPVAENRSFSAGADYDFSETISESNTWAWSTNLDITAELSLGFSLEAAGSGFSMDFSSALTDGQENAGSEQETTSRTVSYTLADDDLGDYFTVDIKEDSVYATPVFDLRAGRSSCPWEGPITRLDGSEINGTQPRDGTILQVNGSPLVEGVAPDGEAVFEISLTNDSATDEQREYGVRVIQTSNPDGAQFNLNGNNLKGPANFFLDPGEDGTQRATLSVKRGPQRYRYDDLEIMMYPPCEYALWQDNATLQRQDTLRVSARFAAPCSDIELFQPRENWSLNAASAQNPLQVIFSDVSTTEPRELENIGLEYRAAGSDVWKNAFTIARDTLAANGSLTDPDINLYNLAEDWAVPLPDGGYELRAFSKCVNSTERVFSAVTPGVIDTKAPETAQVAPSDGALAFGDAITIDFSEPMDCASVITGGTDPTVTLRTEGGTSIPVDAICSDNQTRVRLQPQIDLGSYEDSTLVAEVRGQITQGTAVKNGVTDAVGNPLETASAISSTETWSFTVKREGFAWQQANVAAASIFGEGILFEEALVNGSPQPVVYSIESRTYGADWSTHPWLVVDSTSISGTVNAGSSLPIAFALSDTLSKGVYRDTVDATTALGPESLNLEATVSCPAPFGTPPQGLAFSMNLSAFLDIPAALGGNGVSTDTSDVVAAYVGNQLRGVASVDQVSLGDGTPAFVAFLSIASDRQIGETVTFRLWDASQCRLYQAQETYPFQSNDVIGSPQAPVPITASDVETQSVDLPSGWTWVSTNKVPASGSSVSNVLSTLVPSEGDIVKSQTDGFAQYSRSTGWVGTLSEIVPGEAYLVNVETPSSLVLLGDPAPLTTDLSLQAGWNWVGYLPEQPLLLNDALANLTPAPQAGDIIKSQFGFAQYVGPSIGWIGSLETMDPGRGYFLNLTTAATLTYPDPSTVTTQTSALIAKASPTSAPEGATMAQADFGPRPVRSSDPDAWRTYVRNVTGHRYAEIQSSIERRAAKTSPRRSGPAASPSAPNSDAPDWRVDPAAYASATPVVASLSLDGDVLDDPQTRVGAFVDDELRGVARPRYVEALDETRVFLMLYGEFDQPTPVRFRIYDAGTGLVHDDILVVSGTTDAAVSQEARFPNHMDVRANATYGTVQDPVRLNQGALPEDVLPGQFQFESHYPNPVTRSATIRYALPDQGDVEFEIYDVMGRRVAHTPATPKDAGWHDMQIDASDLASGVYFYRLTAGEKQVTKKLVVVK